MGPIRGSNSNYYRHKIACCHYTNRPMFTP